MKFRSCVTQEKSERDLRTKSAKQDVMAAAESHTGTHFPIHCAGKVVHVVLGFQKWPAKYWESPTKVLLPLLATGIPLPKMFFTVEIGPRV